MHTSVLLAVRDVPASSDWYQALLACQSDMERGHPHRQEFDRIVDSAGRVLLALHSWGAEPETPVAGFLVRDDATVPGQGIVVTFVLDDLDAAVGRARALQAEFVGDVTRLP